MSRNKEVNYYFRKEDGTMMRYEITPVELSSQIGNYKTQIADMVGLNRTERTQLTIYSVYKGKHGILIHTGYGDEEIPSPRLSQLRGMIIDIGRRVKVSTGFTYTVKAVCGEDGMEVDENGIITVRPEEGDEKYGREIQFDTTDPSVKIRYYNQGQAISVFRWEGDTFIVGLKNMNIANPASKFGGVNVVQLMKEMGVIDVHRLFPQEAKYWPICYRFMVSSSRYFSATRLVCSNKGYISFLGANFVWSGLEGGLTSFFWEDSIVDDDADYRFCTGTTFQTFKDYAGIEYDEENETFTAGYLSLIGEDKVFIGGYAKPVINACTTKEIYNETINGPSFPFVNTGMSSLNIYGAQETLIYGLNILNGVNNVSNIEATGRDARCRCGESIMITKPIVFEGVSTTVSVQVRSIDYDCRDKRNDKDADIAYSNFLSSLSIISVSKVKNTNDYFSELRKIPKYSRWFYPLKTPENIEGIPGGVESLARIFVKNVYDHYIEMKGSTTELTNEQMLTTSFIFNLESRMMRTYYPEERTKIVSTFYKEIDELPMVDQYYGSYFTEEEWMDDSFLEAMTKRKGSGGVMLIKPEYFGLIAEKFLENTDGNVDMMDLIQNQLSVGIISYLRRLITDIDPMDYLEHVYDEGYVEWMFDWNDIEFVCCVEAILGMPCIRPSLEFVKLRGVNDEPILGSTANELRRVYGSDAVFVLSLDHETAQKGIIKWNDPSTIEFLEMMMYEEDERAGIDHKKVRLVSIKDKYVEIIRLNFSHIVKQPPEVDSNEMFQLNNYLGAMSEIMEENVSNIFILNYYSEYEVTRVRNVLAEYRHLVMEPFIQEELSNRGSTAWGSTLGRGIDRVIQESLTNTYFALMPPVGTSLKINYEQMLNANITFNPTVAVGCYKEDLSEQDIEFVFVMEELYSKMNVDVVESPDFNPRTFCDDIMFKNDEFRRKLRVGFGIDELTFWHVVACNPMNQKNVLNCVKRYEVDLRTIARLLTDRKSSAESVIMKIEDRNEKIKSAYTELLRLYRMYVSTLGRTQKDVMPAKVLSVRMHGSEFSEIEKQASLLAAEKVGTGKLVYLMKLSHKIDPSNTISMTESGAPSFIKHRDEKLLDKSRAERNRAGRPTAMVGKSRGMMGKPRPGHNK